MKITHGQKKTRDLISEVFIELMKKKGFAKVTVREIIEHAGINRSTFYAYYLDKYDVLDKVEDRLLSGVRDIERDAPLQVDTWSQPEANSTSNTERFIRYMYDNGDLFVLFALDKSSGPAFIEKSNGRVRAVWNELNLIDKLSVPHCYAVAAVVGMANTLIIEWVKNSFRETPEEFLSIFTKFMQNVLPSIFDNMPMALND